MERPGSDWHDGKMSNEVVKTGEFFEEESFDLLAGLEEGHFWFEERNLLISSLLRRHCPKATSFLEIGCGTGFVLRHLLKEFPGIEFSGIEYFDEGLEHARDRIKGATLLQGDARQLDSRWVGIQAIGIFDVLEHIEEDEAVLAEMHRVLSPGGCAIITVPQHSWLWSHSDDFACHVRRYSRKELVSKVENAGFRVERVSSFVSFLLPMMLVSRLLQKQKKRDEVDFAAEFTVHPVLNRFLRAVLSLERILINSGFRFPAGGSLVLVAKKQ